LIPSSKKLQWLNLDWIVLANICLSFRQLIGPFNWTFVYLSNCLFVQLSVWPIVYWTCNWTFEHSSICLLD
jgi:hypothetical protein